MLTLEERVAYLEGRLEDHTGTVGELRSDVRELRKRMDRRFEDLNQKLNRRFEEMDRRFEGLNSKVDRLFLGLDTKIDGVDTSLDAKSSRQFFWLVGIQVAVLVSVVGALVGR